MNVLNAFIHDLCALLASAQRIQRQGLINGGKLGMNSTMLVVGDGRGRVAKAVFFDGRIVALLSADTANVDIFFRSSVPFFHV